MGFSLKKTLLFVAVASILSNMLRKKNHGGGKKNKKCGGRGRH